MFSRAWIIKFVSYIFRRHSGHYQFLCSECDKQFPDKEYLSRHVCGQQFSNKKRLMATIGTRKKCFVLRCEREVIDDEGQENHILEDHFKVNILFYVFWVYNCFIYSLIYWSWLSSISYRFLLWSFAQIVIMKTQQQI